MEITIRLSSLAIGFFVIVMGVSVGSAGITQTNLPGGVGVAVSGTAKIKTDFVPDGKLTAAEIVQVLKLAKQCGLTNPVEVRTFYCLPTRTKGIEVKSADKITGRNTCFDTIYINKISWNGKPGSTNLHIGLFWMDEGGSAQPCCEAIRWTKSKPSKLPLAKGCQLRWLIR